MSLLEEQSWLNRMIPHMSHYWCPQCSWWWMPASRDCPSVVVLSCPEHEEGTGRLEERDGA